MTQVATSGKIVNKCKCSYKDSVNTDSQWSKQEAGFAHASLVRLSVNHNTSVTSGE